MLFLRGFFLKLTERAEVLPKNCTSDFQNNPRFERATCFYVTITRNFEFFQYFNFEKSFLENVNLFRRTGVPLFKRYFYNKRQFQKPTLRQIEWGIQNGTITKNIVLSVTDLFF